MTTSTYTAAVSEIPPRARTLSLGALVRCKGLPRMTFEIVSPSELQKIKEREDVKDVEGVVQIIEIYQHTMAVHVHSKTETGVWGRTPISGTEATLAISSIGISIPLIDLYENAMPADEAKASMME